MKRVRNPYDKSSDLYRMYHEKELARYADRRRALRASALEAYGGKCACCSEDRHEFLAIDHVYGDGAKHRKTIGKNIYRWLKRNNYPIERFRVLCHNCNVAMGIYGKCPHGGIPPIQSYTIRKGHSESAIELSEIYRSLVAA